MKDMFNYETKRYEKKTGKICASFKTDDIRPGFYMDTWMI